MGHTGGVRKDTGFIPFIPEWIAQQYYRHGLFCASQPLPVLVFSIIGILWACFPLLSFQFYGGNAKIWTENPNSSKDSFTTERPRWLEKQPIAYVQQVMVKSAVHPYSQELTLMDAFRGPLASSFKLHLSDIVSFVDKETGLDMDHECLRTDGLSPRYRVSLAHLLPDYGCLIMSPANIWKKDPLIFQEDANIVNTIFNYQSSREGHSSLADVMFGLRQRDTGLTKYPVRNRQRVITYSITIVLRQHKPNFIQALRTHLQKVYPLNTEENQQTNNIINIYFPEQINGMEYLPYTALITGLFFYTLFSCRKIDLIQSKVGIALTAVITILGSLFMSLGLTGTSIGGTGYVYIVPYAIAFIGMENILVITRSIVSTPAHLDVKVRVAQGLSKEGWNITKNLFSQITLLTFGFFLGIVDNSIQEFSIFAVMGLLSDFYLQHFFFITVLSMDISRFRFVDVDVTRKPIYKKSHSSSSPNDLRSQSRIFQCPVSGPGSKYEVDGSHTTGLVAPSLSNSTQQKLPKRVQVVNFWAQRRVVSRIFLLTMVIWIFLFIYKIGIIDYIIKGAQSELTSSMYIPQDSSTKRTPEIRKSVPTPDISKILSSVAGTGVIDSGSNAGGQLKEDLVGKPGGVQDGQPGGDPAVQPGGDPAGQPGGGLANKPGAGQADPTGTSRKSDTIAKLVHKTNEFWKRLPHSHWPMLFGLYNISLYGSYISLLPPITLSVTVPPDAVVQLRNQEQDAQSWTIDAMNSNTQELIDDEDVDDFLDDSPELSPFVPTSPGELILAFTLSIPSLLFLIYLSIVCYRFVCTKNYAEWRTGKLDSKHGHYTQIVQEGVPISLDAHSQEIEHLLTDGHIILSHCIGGKICIWDSLTGECISTIRSKPLVVPDSPDGDHADDLESEDSSDKQTQNMFSLSTNPPFGGPGVGGEGLRTRLSARFKFRSKKNLNLSDAYQKFNENFKKKTKNNCSSSMSPVKESVWSLDLADGLVVLACNTGKIEAWNPMTGELCCSYQDGRRVPVNIIRLVRSRIISIKLDGSIEFLDLVFPSSMSECSQSRIRTFSIDSMDSDSILSYTDRFQISWRHTVKAHAQCISCVAVQGSRLITGSEDHTLRVFRIEDGVGVYTLHGHCGPITSVFIDRHNHSAAGSASQDGILCMWDLLTGACVYSVQAHDSAVLSLEYSPSYIISYGQDEKICVWERYQGHLINTINTCVAGDQSSLEFVLLTQNLLVTGKYGALVVWDLRLPDPVRIVRLEKSDSKEKVRLLRQIGDSVVCSCGNSIRLVRFPMLMEKLD